MRFAPACALCVVLVLLAPFASGIASDSKPSVPWLFVSDVHYDVYASPEKKPNVYGGDTDTQLMTSFLAEAKRVAPDPPVVVIAGDFISHNALRADSPKTMALIARLFRTTFPNAQFLFTLGNNDSTCGDYAPPIDGNFLASVARSWAPLVNKHGAAPDFVRTFSHDGSYVATLPIPRLRAVVINDNFFSLRYAQKCAPKQAPGDELAAFSAALAAAPAGTHNWVLFHIPPGIDAFSTTHVMHGLVVLPFLRPRAREELTDIISDKRSRVALAIAGHTHKFAFRVIGDGPASVPMLLVPSVSPIFANAPSFLTASVTPDNRLGNVVQYAFDGHDWSRIGDLAELGVPKFEPGLLRKLQGQLLTGNGYREIFATLYEGGADSEISPRTWSVYACATTQLSDSAFERCAGKRGYSVLTRRGLVVAFVAGVLAILLFGGIYLRDRRRRAVIRRTGVEGAPR